MSVAYVRAKAAALRAAEAATDAAEAITDDRINTAVSLLDEAAGQILRAQLKIQEARDER